MAENIDLQNEELQNALQIIQYTHRSLFLTGKAGTGKSTFLRYIAANTKKKHVVLAPTGIAAINAGGSTLHSFFKLPFYPLLPNDSKYSVRNLRNTMKYNSEKIKLLRLHRQDSKGLQPQYARTFRRKTVAFGGRYIPVGTGSEGRRQETAQPFLFQQLFL